MSDDLPDWLYKPPLSPTEHIKYYGLPGAAPSDILSGPGYDVRAHYSRVKALYDAYPLRTKEQCKEFTTAIVRKIVKAARLPSVGVLAAIIGVVEDIFQNERIYEPILLNWDAHSTSDYVQLVLRPHLTDAEHFFTQRHLIIPAVEKTISDFLIAVVRNMPEAAFVDSSAGAPTLSLIEVMPEAAGLIQDIGGYFCDAARDASLANRRFYDLRQRLVDNLTIASGIKPGQLKDLDQLVYAGDAAKELPIRDVAVRYLDNTPFIDLLLAPVPFIIPDHPYRFEHTFCLGPSGSGKTTLLQQIVLDDLAKPDPPAMVIIDPKGLMVERLQRLDVFNPDTGRLRDRLVIVDPTSDPPPALNMFHPMDKWDRMYADNVRRQIENQTISTYAYIFSSLESALTQKQTVAFTFAVRLLFTMQSASIHTLIDFLDDPAKTLAQSRFRPDIERLDETSRRFFQSDYYSTSFGETRQQIKARLYSILQRPEFVAMFSTPERKLDMFDCLQKRKIVLVNTAMSILGSEGSQLFGRYMIALTLNAAFERISVKDRTLWNPVFLIIDEFQLFADEIKTPELLRLAREYNLGVTIAVQDMHGRPFNDALRNAISTNTSIKYAASPEGVDLNYAARDLRCETDFLRQQTKTATHARFASYVRGLTERAVSISVPFGNTDVQPQMSVDAHARLVERNSQRLTMPPATPPATQPEPLPPMPASEAKSPQPATAPPAPSAGVPPPANDPDAGAHTEAAPKW